MHRFARFVLVASAGAVILLGCGLRASETTTAGAPGTDVPQSGAPSAAQGAGQGSTGGALAGAHDAGVPSAPSPVPPDQCSDAARLVYVVSRENDLYSFRPDTMTFTKVGALTCPAGINEFPFSMAVDRAGTAWILYTDGSLYAASTADASCHRTAFVRNPPGFTLFGMGFAATAPGASTDVLYISENVAGGGLGVLDLATLTAKRVGPYGGALAGHNAELTGTGDGKLYGFFTTIPAQVAEIGKASGATSSAVPLGSLNAGTDWAFSFWGGDFYLYTGEAVQGAPDDDDAGGGSTVTRYRPSDGTLTVLSPGIGFLITGAGVSTCAPTVPPPPPR
jgi:hypothetical protein